MNEVERTKIKDIKQKVTAMIEERSRMESGRPTAASPSDYWAAVCSSFDYMLALPEEYFSKLRIHAYHITGDSYLHYDRHRDPQVFRTQVDLDRMTDGIPDHLILNEPEDGIGFSYEDGRFVNIDVLRYQRVVNTLYRRGILARLADGGEQTKNSILEIGGGYGGLAHHLSNILDKVTYVIVDLPETLLFSASYLALHNPNKKIYLYDSSDIAEVVESDNLRSNDIILIPNYQLESLANWQFELAINMISFQEMNAPQVNDYLDFIRERCTGVLYSWNIDSHVKNSGLPSMAEMLAGRFDFLEVGQPAKELSKKRRIVDGLKSIASTVGLADPPRQEGSVARYIYRGREYICRPILTSDPG